MATITSTGNGSGLDIESIVTKLMEVERTPKQVMVKRQTQIEAQISAYGSIKSSVSTFRDAMKGLNSIEKFEAKKIQIADDTVAKVSAGSSAISGSYELQVKQLAQGQKLATKAFTSENDILGTGNIVIEFGSNKPGTGFVPNSDKTTQTITIGSGQSTLGGIRDAINSAKIGVSASLLNDGTGYRLVLKSDSTGTANGFKVSVNGDSDGDDTNAGGLSLLNFDPANPPAALLPGDTDPGVTREVVAAKDAQLVVDGINVTKSTNVVSDVIQGVTMNLTKVTDAALPVKIDVAQDKDKIKEAINNFAKGYNDLRKVITDLTAFDPTTNEGGPLEADFTARSMLNRVSRTLTSTIQGLTGQYGYLAQIGVSLNKDGTLAVQDSKLNKALDENPDDVAALFSEIGRSTDSLIQYNSATQKTLAGKYDVNVTQIGTRAELATGAIGALANTNGTLTSPFQINASNNSLSVVVDGVTSGAITLTEKDYTTMDQLTAELQSKINSDATLHGKGKSVTVGYQGGALKFTSNSYGSGSSIGIANSSFATSLGIVATGTPGQDAQGSLGGQAASGTGQFLFGATGTAMEGLKVQVVGGDLGARGSVAFSHGYAYELGKLADALLSTDGPLATRTEGLNKDLTRVKKREADFDDRMTLVEKRIRAQFTAMDTLVGQLKSTSTYLSQQLK